MGTLATIGGLMGLMGGKGGGGDVKVSTSVQQSNSQLSGITFNPVVNISSPDAYVAPETGGNVPITGQPVSQSIPTTQNTTDSAGGYGLIPSLLLPTSNVAGQTPASVSVPSSGGLLDDLNLSDPFTLVLIAGAGIALYYMMR